MLIARLAEHIGSLRCRGQHQIKKKNDEKQNTSTHWTMGASSHIKAMPGQLLLAEHNTTNSTLDDSLSRIDSRSGVCGVFFWVRRLLD